MALKLGHNKPFPSTSERMTGTMDIWWLLHDGGILVLVSYLLHRHAGMRSKVPRSAPACPFKHAACSAHTSLSILLFALRCPVWRQCRLRLFTVVEGPENIAGVRADLVNYLQVRPASPRSCT